jgi:hypothetical protein
VKGSVIFLRYKKYLCLILIFSVFLTSCSSLKTEGREDAQAVLEDIIRTFSIEEGSLYSDRMDASYPLTASMLERMFPDRGDTADLVYVVSSAVWFSRRFSEKEIIVFQICDLSHQRELLYLLAKRAKKKENAVVFANGIYLYLICTEQNEAIMRYLG